MKIVTVLGTRPNIIKEVLIHRALKDSPVEEVILHTGQHYDYDMSDVFLDDFQLPQPDYRFERQGDTILHQTGSMVADIGEVLMRERPTATLVYGDVDSTAAGALASAKLGIPVIHIEGGVRSDRLYNPEEINRRVSDAISAYVFASTRTDLENLRAEGFGPERAELSGDIVMDVLLHTIDRFQIEVGSKGYVLVTIHRAENVESPARLGEIVEALVALNRPWIFPAHPRVKQRLEDFELWDRLASAPTGTLMNPQGYREFTELLAGAERVLTDSGGVRREAYILGKPVVVPIDIVWFPEILDAGWMRVVDPPKAEVLAWELEHFSPSGPRPPIFGDGRAHERIASRIVELCREWTDA